MEIADNPDPLRLMRYYRALWLEQCRCSLNKLNGYRFALHLLSTISRLNHYVRLFVGAQFPSNNLISDRVSGSPLALINAITGKRLMSIALQK